MKKLLLIVGIIAVVCGCASMGSGYKDANITIATHPGMVEGMTFVTGMTDRVGNVYSLEDAGIQAANHYAKKGYKDVTVLVEWVGQTQVYSGGTTAFDGKGPNYAPVNMVRASVYKLPD